MNNILLIQLFFLSIQITALIYNFVYGPNTLARRLSIYLCIPTLLVPLLFK